MDRIFLHVLNMSVTASFVIGVVFLARFFLRRAPKVISYTLWAVVLFNLLCPFKPESAFSLIPFQAEPIPAQRAIVPGQELNLAEAALYSMQTPGDDVYIPINPNSVDINHAPYNGNPMSYLFGYQAYLVFGSYLWPIGAAFLLLYAIVGYIRLKQRVSFAVRVDGDVYETDRIDSPFVLGLLRPRIYIPVGMEPSLTAHIIEHERTHIKRRDYVVSIIAFVALALHWFNPLVWAAYMLMLRDMESSCDEAVLRNSSGDIRREYSTALLNFSSNRKRLSFPLAFGEQGVKERVKNVLNFRKPSMVIIVAAVTLVAVLSVGFAVNRANGIELPDADGVAYVSIDRYIDHAPLGDIKIAEKNEIGDVLNALSGAAKTLRPAIYDYPTGNDYLIIRVHQNDNREMRTFCLYTDGANYIEEPYIGVYRPKRGQFNYLYSVYEAYTNTGILEWNGATLNMTLTDVRAIAQKIGPNLTMGDLRDFIGTDVGSGIFVMRYYVENSDYMLLVGSNSLNEASDVFYADLIHVTDGDENASIDIRYYDVDKFLVDGTKELVRPLPESRETTPPLDGSLVLGDSPEQDETWRLNPEEVVSRFAAEVLNFQGTAVFHHDNNDAEYIRVIFTKQTGDEIHIDLYQPAKKGDGGIWDVECWFDENNRMYQVRDLTALPPLFHNDDNVPVHVRESIRNAVVGEWTETFGRYYQVLGFYADNVTYTETDGAAELKFGMTMVTQNFYKDPDTVGYIREAKESGSSYYQQMYDEYNMPRTGNFDLKATMSLTASGEVEAGSIQSYSNVSPNGEEYVPTKATDFIISE